TSLGLAIAAIGIALCEGTEARVAPAAGLWLIAIPVYDLFAAIVRRLCARRSVFEPDHHHLHHVLIEQGFSHRAALALMLSLALVLAACGIAGHAAGVPDGALLLGWLRGAVAYYRLMGRRRWVLATAGKLGLRARPKRSPGRRAPPSPRPARWAPSHPRHARKRRSAPAIARGSSPAVAVARVTPPASRFPSSTPH